MSGLQKALLAGLLAAAALLRFAGLGQDLRRGSPTPDEWENFVGPVRLMWEHRSPDPNVHGGYPGLFNWVAFAPMAAGLRWGGEAGSCLAARALVAAFSTANVLLLFLLVRRPWGPWPALFGAALLAFSRNEVSEAHFITPDVLVVSAFLGMALAVREPGRGAVAGPAWSGLGMAVKYSGVLLLAGPVAALLADRRWKRVPLALAAGAVAFAAAAPYALSRGGGQGRGIRELAVYYFGPLLSGRLLETAGRQLGEIASWIWVALGPVAALLAVAAALAPARSPARRALVAPAAVLAASLLVLALTGQVYPRHLLVSSACVTILAAAGFAALRERLPAMAVMAIAGLALGLPLTRSLALARGYLQPTELDRVAGWIEGQPRPLRVATSLPRLRLEDGVEVRAGLSLWDVPPAALAHYGLVVAPRDVAARLHGLQEVRGPEPPGAAGALVVLRPTSKAGAPWPAPARSAGTAPGAERAFDGRPHTAWMAPPGPGWLEAEWPGPRLLEVVEVLAADGEGQWPQRLQLSVRGAAGAWSRVEAFALRPQRTRLQQPPHGQVYVLTPPVAADGLRIERKDGGPWSLAEVKVAGGGG